MREEEIINMKLFEDSTNKNLKTISDYTKDSRNLVRELYEEVDNLRRTIEAQNAKIEQLRLQLASIQTVVYRNGS
jgi:predicted RNase H-like nuclease (RuvC/YqgF family)